MSNSDRQTLKVKVGEKETHIQRNTHTKKHTHMYTSSVFFFFLREFLASFETAAKKLPPSPSSPVLEWTNPITARRAAHVITKSSV
jgi:hypothetical protein